MLQGNHCRLDTVLLTLGYLYGKFSQSDRTNSASGEDLAVSAVLNSLEKRWKKADQEVFIAAVILNPFFRLEAFKSTQTFSISSISHLMHRLWLRFFGRAADSTLDRDVDRYCWRSDYFSDLESCAKSIKEMAASDVSDIHIAL